jgi:uncharacterized protein (TIGR02145 family)
MLKVRKNLRKVVAATAICLAGGATMFAQETGVVINGVTWATRNVDAFGTFAAAPESSGMFYQWSRPTAWAATGSVSGWDSSNPTGTTWETANDPSPSGWRLPTKAEMESLFNTTYVTRVYTTQNGINGYLFTDIATSKSIFLPAAGYRDRNDGQLINAGLIGLYWSSTVNSSGDYVGCISFGDTYAAVSDTYKPGGGSVRCVKYDSTGINEVSVNTENAKVKGYFDILGRKLTEEPTKGIYIIQYDNGKTKKVMK